MTKKTLPKTSFRKAAISLAYDVVISRQGEFEGDYQTWSSCTIATLNEAFTIALRKSNHAPGVLRAIGGCLNEAQVNEFHTDIDKSSLAELKESFEKGIKENNIQLYKQGGK